MHINKSINDGTYVDGMCVFQISNISVSVYLCKYISRNVKFCVDLQLLLHSTVSNSHINIRLEVSHKQKLKLVINIYYTSCTST